VNAGTTPNMIGATHRETAEKRIDMASKSPDDGSQLLDVREIDGEPFDDIMAALGALDDGETLVLVNSFEPEPLYNVLEQRGFEHETTAVDDDEYRVEITHAG